MAFIDALTEARAGLSQNCRERLSPLFDGDRLQRLASHLERLSRNRDQGNESSKLSDAGALPDVMDQALPMLDAYLMTSSSGAETPTTAVTELVRVLEAIQTPTLLLLLGRRPTKDSIHDERAYPPSLKQLLASASIPCGDASGISVAARSLAKYSLHEIDDNVHDGNGSVERQNEAACSRIAAIHDTLASWNIYSHYQNGLVYEARDENGNGACWTHDGMRFIGFVAPSDVPSQPEPPPPTPAIADVPSPESNDEIAFDALPEVVDRAVIAERYSKGQRRFENLDLSGIDLQNLVLSGVIFKGSNLSRAKLFNTNLEAADLSDCDLQNTYLVKTNLSQVIARRAKFHGCRMDGMHLKGLDLQSADVGECGLKGAILESCLMKATKLRGSDLTDAKVLKSRMYGISTEGSTWANAHVDSCTLRHSYLGNTDFSNATFERCRFESATLTGANCTSATFDSCDFVEADMANANLRDAKLPFAQMARTILTGTNLEKADLNQARLNRANLARATLNGANLSDADLTQADLSRADLRTANLSGAILDRTDLSWADVVDTIVDDSTRFSAAKTTGVDFGTNWLLRQRVLDSAHDLTIQHYCRKHRVAGFLWWALLGCGKRNYLLLFWGIAFVFMFAGLMAVNPSSFNFGQASPTFIDHLRNSLAVFVTLDLAVDKGTDTYGRSVMLAEMLMSYLMLGFMASLFSSIFPRSPD